MPKGKRGSHGKPDPLEWKLTFSATDNRYATRDEFVKATNAARALFLKTGEEYPGVHVTVSWRNPESESDYSRIWKTSDDSDQTLDDAFATLKKAIQYRR